MRNVFLRRRAAVAAVAAVGLAGGADARDLGEILRDKGVISSGELEEAGSRTDGTPPATIAYKEGKGFVFRTGDGRFEATVGGRVQVRSTLLDVDGDFTDGAKGREDRQTFDVPRARVWAKGRLYHPGLGYELQVDLAGSGGDVIRDAFLDYLPVPALGVRAGQFKTPYARQELTSSGRLQLVDRSIATNALRLDRQLGVMLYGTQLAERLEYAAGIFNGDGRNRTNTDGNLAYVTRVALNPLGPVPYDEPDFGASPTPLLALGVGYAYNEVRGDDITTAARLDPTDAGKIIAGGTVSQQAPILRTVQPFFRDLANPERAGVSFNHFGADATIRWHGLSASGEYLLAAVDADRVRSAPPFGADPGAFNARGWYLQAGYFLIPGKLEAAFRWSELDPNDDVDHNDQREIRGGLGYYFRGHNLKIQGDVGSLRSEGQKTGAGGLAPRQDMEYRLQVQFIF